MEDNSDNYQNDNKSLNNEDDDELEDSINLNGNECPQNFEEFSLESKKRLDEKHNIEYTHYLENNKNRLTELHNKTNCNYNEVLNFPPQSNQNNYYNEIIQNPFTNNENFSTSNNFNSYPNEITNFTQKNNKNYYHNNNSYNQPMNQGNLIQDFNPNYCPNNSSNSFIQYNPNNYYNNRTENPFINRGNYSLGFNHFCNQNEIPNFPPEFNQNNNYNNMLNSFMSHANFSPEFFENDNYILNLIISACIIYLNSIKNNYYFQNVPQNNAFNFEINNKINNNSNNNSNNNNNQIFQNTEQNLKQNEQNFNNNDFNYSDYKNQNNNYYSYGRIKKNKKNKRQKTKTDENMFNTSNNNQIRKNKQGISKKIPTNENKYINQNTSNNKINLSGNESIKIIKEFDIKEIFDINKLKMIPDIKKFIREKAKEKNYALNDEENKMLDYNNYDSNKTIFFNEFMFYSKERISIYSPHILKGKNKLISILLPENEKKLNLLDFQYINNQQEMNDILFKTLQRRIDEYNISIEKNDFFINNGYNEKKFGFCKTENDDKYYLYSIIDEDIIKSKLEENDLENLKNNLTINASPNNTKGNILAVYAKDKRYMNELNFEELILFTILDRLKDKYVIFPRILFYENYMTLFGDRIQLLNQNLSGYNKFDFILYSKDHYKYGYTSHLIIQNYYNYEKQDRDLYLEINKDNLYFFELKSSSDFINDEFFDALFNKCLEFTHLFESKNMIIKNTKKEIILIYDNKGDSPLSYRYEQKIMDFLKNNKNYSFNIVHSIKTTPYFSHSSAINKYNEIKKEQEILAEKIKKLNEDFKKVKEQINGI